MDAHAELLTRAVTPPSPLVTEPARSRRPAALPASSDVVVVGAGASGLATAIFTRRLAPSRSVVLVEGARTPGAKILVSGGGRCNITNVSVSARDFWGGPRSTIGRVLRSFSVRETIAFFRSIGVAVHEEQDGKLFPDTNRSRDVLEALLREAERTGSRLCDQTRVTTVRRLADGFRVLTTRGDVEARAVVLATGGRSLPRSGSDGAGLTIANALGHTIVPTTPALTPLVLDTHGPDATLHRRLAGVTVRAELAIWIDGVVGLRLSGSLLWTHGGVSGPVALDASRHWLRAELDGRAVRVTANFCPGVTFDTAEARWTTLTRERPKRTVQSALAVLVPASLATALLRHVRIDPAGQLAHLARVDRRRLVHALVEWPMSVVGTRGYDTAEATAGGVVLSEIDPRTMQSRVCPGLFLTGEILDVDGRVGGFNFQWAWSSAHAAACALASQAFGAW